MSLDTPNAQVLIQRGSLALSSALCPNPEGWRALLPEDKLLAIAAGQATHGHLGAALACLEKGHLDTFTAILTDPHWLACSTSTLSQKNKLRAGLAEAFAHFPNAMNAIAIADPASAWLGTVYLIHPDTSTKTIFSSGIDKIDLLPHLFTRNLFGQHIASTLPPFLTSISASHAPAIKEQNWKRLSLAMDASSKASTENLFSKNPTLENIACACIETGMFLDAGHAGNGDAYAPSAAIEAARELLARGFPARALCKILVLWAASDRGQSLAALELASTLPSISWDIPKGRANLNPARGGCYTPEMIDAAWVAAANATSEYGLLAAAKLRSLSPQSNTPCHVLSDLGSKEEHPLLILQTLWNHALRAPNALPHFAIDNAMDNFNKACGGLPQDWHTLIFDWAKQAKAIADELHAGRPHRGFPADPLSSLKHIAQTSRVPISPLEYRLRFPVGNVQSHRKGQGSANATMHCALASSTLGFTIADDLSRMNTRDLYPEEKAGIEAALIREACMEDKTASAPTRLRI